MMEALDSGISTYSTVSCSRSKVKERRQTIWKALDEAEWPYLLVFAETVAGTRLTATPGSHIGSHDPRTDHSLAPDQKASHWSATADQFTKLKCTSCTSSTRINLLHIDAEICYPSSTAESIIDIVNLFRRVSSRPTTRQSGARREGRYYTPYN